MDGQPKTTPEGVTASGAAEILSRRLGTEVAPWRVAEAVYRRYIPVGLCQKRGRIRIISPEALGLLEERFRLTLTK